MAGRPSEPCLWCALLVGGATNNGVQSRGGEAVAFIPKETKGSRPEKRLLHLLKRPKYDQENNRVL